MKNEIIKDYATRMKAPAFCLRPFALIIIFLWLCSSTLWAEELGIKASANRSQLYIGESFILEVTVSGSTGMAEFDLAGIKNANIRHLGIRNISNYSITIINGKMTREGFTGFVSSYEVTPLAPGKFQAGPVAVKINGQTLSDRGPEVLVTDIEKQDRVMLSVSASRETALIDEPFSVVLGVQNRAMPGEAAALEPVFPDNPPALLIPWLDEDLSGLAGPDVRRMLTNYLVSHWNQSGITINKFTLTPDPFDISSMFSREQRKAKFALPVKTIHINGRPYYEYKLQFDYTPKDEGAYVFGPVIFKGAVPEKIDQHGRAAGANIFAVGPAATVRVIPPPDEGRPESYSGAIGSNLAVKAALDTTSCKLGDPLTLTLTVSGQVKLDKMLPPKLSLQTNLFECFTVYDNTVQSSRKEAYNQYLYTIRPVKAGQIEIPPIEVAYYDVISRSYRKTHTQPIPLLVQRGAEITEAQIIGNTNRVEAAGEEDLREKAAAPIRLTGSGAFPASLAGDQRGLLAAAAGPVFYCVLVFAALVGRLRRKMSEKRHIESARARACKRLHAAAQACRKNPEPAGEMICDAMRKYLGERLCRDTSSATPPEAIAILEKIVSARDKSLAREFGAFYEKYFNASFARLPGQDRIPDDCRAIADLVKRIERGLKESSRRQAGRFRPPRLMLLAAVCLAAGWACALDTSERIFIWDEANAAMQNAKSQPEFLQAARIYQRLLDDGVRNGPLLYNLGTALLHAGRHAEALDAFERAERYFGRQEDNSRNMQIAYARLTKSRTAVLPWYRAAAFWHYDYSCPQKTGVAAAAFLVFWLALALRRAGLKRVTGTLALLSLAVFAVFASSAAASWQAENSPRRYHLDAPVPAPSSTNVPAAGAGAPGAQPGP